MYAAHRLVEGRHELRVLQHFRRSRDSTTQLTGILRSARAFMEVSHPNLMRVYGADPVGEEIVVSSDFIEGESLAEMQLQADVQRTEIALPVSLRILSEVLQGLAAMHAAVDARRRPLGLAHGLVTPDNVIVGLDGVSRLVSVLHPAPLVVPPELKPRMAYLAPEVLRGGDVGPRADIYSAGAFLWEALAGERLYGVSDEKPAATLGELLAKAEKGPTRPPLASDAGWAMPLVEVALRALSYDPAKRFASADEMHTLLLEHAKLAPQTTVAMLVRQVAGERILKRRFEFAQKSISSRPPSAAAEPRARADTDAPDATDDTLTARVDNAELTDDDSITKVPKPPPPATDGDETEEGVTLLTRALPPGDSVTAESPVRKQPAPSSVDDDSTVKPQPSPLHPSHPSAREMAAIVGAPARDSDGHSEDITEEAVTAVRPVASGLSDDDSVTRDAPVVSGPTREPIDSVTKDDERAQGPIAEPDEDRVVTEIVAVPPDLAEMATEEDSVTQDRPPVPRPTPRSAPPPPSPAALPRPQQGSVDPASISTKGSVVLSPSVTRQPIVEVVPPSGGAGGVPLPSPPPPPPLPDFEPPPPASYVRLGIATALAAACAFGLLVFVIVRATRVAEVARAPRLEGPRVKAPHTISWDEAHEHETVAGHASVVAPASATTPRRNPTPRRK